MKLLLSSLGAALFATAAFVAAPATGAQPATAVAADPGSVASSPSERPPQDRIDLARHLISLTMPEDSTLQQMRDLSVQLASAAPWMGGEAGDPHETQQFMDRLIVKAAPTIHMHMMSIREVIALTYAREFSAAELQSMNAFAETPAGKHYFARHQLIDLDPGIVAQETMMQEAILPMYFEVRKEMCAEATAKRIAAGDKKAKCPLAKQDESQEG